MKTWRGLLFSFFALSVYGETFLDTTCDGDWEPYKNEKCLKVFDTELQSYEDAESYCAAKYRSTLVSIGLEDKQKFLENLLKTKGILNEVWIGLKYESDNKYVWSDDTVFHYSNWEEGSPKNNSSYCVQMYTDDNVFGKWVDVSCTKKNVVLCEKVQPWSSEQIQNELMNIKQNLIPLGFIYAQLPKEKPPSEIWPWMTWDDVTSDYAGVFFRAEGGDSDSFGSIQEPASPRIDYVAAIETSDFNYQENAINISPNGQLSYFIHVATFYFGRFDTYRGLAFRQTSDEVRPLNMAIRIWKRRQ